MKNRAEWIKRLLTEALAPSELQIADDSHRHAGHSGARPEGETHFTVRIIADAFAGHGRVARHRMVNQILKPVFESGLHALALTTKAPGE